jgi:hypothetical protein
MLLLHRYRGLAGLLHVQSLLTNAFGLGSRLPIPTVRGYRFGPVGYVAVTGGERVGGMVLCSVGETCA